MKMKNILSARQFTRQELSEILSLSKKTEKQLQAGKLGKVLEGKIVACVFFEPSTRTRLSFESAALRLGARVISVENAFTNSSAQKGETLEDTIKIISGYADIIVLRHPEPGSADRAAKVSKVPIINAGDGAREHPTQGLLDLYTIQKEQGRLKKLNVAFVGDMLFGRTVHSLSSFLSQYQNNRFFFVSPKNLALAEEYKQDLARNKVLFQESVDLEKVLKLADVIYMTRVQKERFGNIKDYHKVKDAFLLKPEHLRIIKKDAVIMHPLPRLNEISPEIDVDPRAAYFRQAQNGLYVRMALLLYSLNIL